MVKLKHSYCLNLNDNDKNIDLLKANSNFIAPNRVDLRDYCTPTDNQHNTPQCAAYTAANFAENILWRVNDYPVHIDPNKIYAYAKNIDGYPKSDGTTLTAVAKGLIKYKILDCKESDINIIYKNSLNDIKYSIHKYGCLMTAFNVTKSWFGLTSRNFIIDYIPDDDRENFGHAMLACGYTNNHLILQNSWGVDWGRYGFAFISWELVQKYFVYGCTIKNSLKNI